MNDEMQGELIQVLGRIAAALEESNVQSAMQHEDGRRANKEYADYVRARDAERDAVAASSVDAGRESSTSLPTALFRVKVTGGNFLSSEGATIEISPADESKD